MSRSRALSRGRIPALIVGCCIGYFLRGEQQMAPAHSTPNSASSNSNTGTVDGSSTTEMATFGGYRPAQVESYMMDNYERLGFAHGNWDPPTCQLYTDASATTPEVHAKLNAYTSDLRRYFEVLDHFQPDATNLMTEIKGGGGGGAQKACRKLRMHPAGLAGLFPSGQLSLSASGYVEPLLPPMRHPGICNQTAKAKLMNMNYLVHDFEAMCQQLKPTSRLVLIDMGASLDFHGGGEAIMWLLRLYERMGFVFDHIYAMEITKLDPNRVFEKLPLKYYSSYHWMNVGISADERSKLNPLHSILKQFEPDDFVVVKLDIDTGSIELPLARQLLNDDAFADLVDHFYFEHHVHLGELSWNWKGTKEGTIAESLHMFSQLREKGIPSHFWP